MADSDTAIREGDIAKAFDKASAQVVGAAVQYSDVKVNDSQDEIINMLGDIQKRMNGSASNSSTEPVGPCDSRVRDGDDCGSSRSSDEQVLDDSEDDALFALCGVKSAGKADKAKAKAKGGSSNNKHGVRSIAAQRPQKLSARSPAASSLASSSATTRLAGGSPSAQAGPSVETLVSVSKRLKVSGGEEDPETYLNSNGFSEIREKIAALVNRLEEAPVLLNHASEVCDVKNMMVKLGNDMKPALQDFGQKYWVVKKRVSAHQDVKALLEDWKRSFHAPSYFIASCMGDIDHTLDGTKLTAYFKASKPFFNLPRTLGT